MNSYQRVIVSSIGEFGRSQVLITLASTGPKFIIAWSMVMMSFAIAQPNWWIYQKQFNSTSNTTATLKVDKSCPESTNQPVFFEANMYTIVSEWNLICDREWITTAILTSQMAGVLVGAAVMGQLGDWIGRKRSMLIAYAMDLVFIFILGFSVNWQMMISCVFFLGFAMGGCLVLYNVYMLEFIGTKWRSACGVLPFWGLGLMFFGVLFKFLPNWRHLCMTTAITGIPMLILLCLTPRSIRWLFTNGRFEEGKQIIRQIAKRNKLPEPDLSSLEKMIQEELHDKAEPSYSYLSLLKFKTTRGKTIVLSFQWFTSAFAYYGLTLGVSRLSGDITINMVMMGAGEVVCMGMVWLLFKCFGRKYTTMALFLLTGFLSFGIPVTYYVARTKFQLTTSVLALTSRFFLSAAWQSLILLTAETYPTVVRSAGYGFVSVIARIAGMVAPQTKTLSNILAHLPFTLNGVLAVISGLFCLFLTDTYTTEMRDHLEIASTSKKSENVDLQVIENKAAVVNSTKDKQSS